MSAREQTNEPLHYRLVHHTPTVWLYRVASHTADPSTVLTIRVSITGGGRTQRPAVSEVFDRGWHPVLRQMLPAKAPDPTWSENGEPEPRAILDFALATYDALRGGVSRG
jgi:hypothetical protein